MRRVENAAAQPIPPVRVVETPGPVPQPVPLSEADRIVQESLRREERGRVWRERKACGPHPESWSSLSPNPPMDRDGRREDRRRGMRELQGEMAWARLG